MTDQEIKLLFKAQAHILEKLCQIIGRTRADSDLIERLEYAGDGSFRQGWPVEQSVVS